MATSTELLRAAEHMRRRGVSNDGGRRSVQCIAAADELEREAARLLAVEAHRCKRSWPEGWPPFSVLRRAYMSLGIKPQPSLRWFERMGFVSVTRGEWRVALALAGQVKP